MRNFYAVSCVFLVTLSPAAQDPFEPDNSPAQARTLNGTTIETGRSLPESTDEDWYRFTLDQGATVVFETLHRAPSNGEIEFVLYDDTVTAITFDEDAFIRDLNAGSYFMVLKPIGNDIIPSYRLSYSLYPYMNDRFEPNDFQVGAPKIETGRIYGGLNISPDEEDWYEFDVPAKGGGGRPILIQASSPMRTLGVEVFNATPFRVLGFFETRIVGFIPTGTYWLALTEENDTFHVPSYDFTIWFRDEPDPYENNNAINLATRLPVRGANHSNAAQEQVHNLLPAGDQDWFRFFIEGADNFSFNAFSVVGDDPQIEVFDKLGNPIAGPESFSVTVLDPPNGEYTARVTATSTPASGDCYEVFVNSIPIPRLTQGSIVGIVEGGTKGTSIANATVQVNGTVFASTKTDATGAYVIDAVPQGAYNISASAQGFVGTQVSTVVGSAVTTRNFALESNANAADLNGDNQVTAVDIQIVINAALGLGGSADVNNDGNTNASDVQLVINAALGL